MVNTQKIKNFIRFYNETEIQSLNYVFGKSASNNWFTQEELAFACDIDLYNKDNLTNAKNDWLNRNFE